MKMSKIIKVVPYDEKQKGKWALYDVYYEAIPDQKVVMTQAQYNLARFEDELFRRGIDPKDIQKHNELVTEYCEDERAREGECS